MATSTMDMHSLQRLVLRTCKENISLNNEIALLDQDLMQAERRLREKEDLLMEQDELIESLRYQLEKAGGGVPSHVGSTGSFSTSCMTVEPREEPQPVTTSEEDNKKEEQPVVPEEDDDDEESVVVLPQQQQQAQSSEEKDFHDSTGSGLSMPSYSHEDYDDAEEEDAFCPTVASSAALENHDYFSVQAAVEGIQKWFFLKGGHLPNIRDFISAYSSYLREILDVPLDRLFIAGVMLNPKVAVYTWKSELGELLQECKVPKETWENRKAVYHPDAPFLQFLEGKTHRIRIKKSEKPHIPHDCSWYNDKGYQDYYALPMYYQGEFVGAMSWATKHPMGFSKKHLEFLARHLHALTAFLRLHTNDIILTTLANQLEEEVAERTADLANANQRIMQQSAAQLKNFACMSHEIRTPLNCIIGLSSLLASDDTMARNLNDTQKESIRMIIRSGDLLLSVVNDVLDYSRLESGNIEINMEPTDLRAVLELVLSSMTPKLKARKLKAQSNFDAQLPACILMDESRLQQILYNLLGNAVKFSKEGGAIEYNASLVTSSDDSNRKMVRIAVRDYGKGIAKGDLASIFEPFNQGTGRTSRDYGGTGLGLAITANLVKGMNGTISVDSEAGTWTEFVVQLPCVEALPTLKESDEEEEHNPEGIQLDMTDNNCHPLSPLSKRGLFRQRTSGTVVDRRGLVRQDSLGQSSNHSRTSMTEEEKAVRAAQPRRPKVMEKYAEFLTDQSRILVVDDNMVNRKVLVHMLDRMGHKLVDTAENGLVACELEVQHKYDLILMDMEMPVMDGLESCQTILARTREDGTLPPKVIFVTAHALDTFQAKAMAAGGSGFLTKPFHLKKLTSVFNSLDWRNNDTTTRAADS